MKRIIISIAVASLIAVFAVPALAKKKRVIRAAGGTNIGGVGLVIDASYDPRFDNFVPGYKVINVAVINQSFNIIHLDPDDDRWKIKLVGKKKLVPVIHDLRRAAPKTWAKLSEKARNIMSYPLFIPVGARQVIDVFVPDSVDAANFTELDIFLKSLNVRIEVLSRQ